ncbi:MAG: MarR family transcriptional regulator [Kordiimonadaceae bacterium]|nr:MarR family transcriptional regulator [Kordiimonadaceae bacterium]
MPKQHFNDYLLYQMAMASHVISHGFHEELAKTDIGPVAWRILYCVWSSPGMRLTELARHVLYKQPRVTKRVAQLEEEGLLVKVIKKEDRRNVYLHLTDKGRALVVPLIKKSEDHENAVFSVLSSDDLKSFRKTLAVLIASADTL